MVYNIKIPMFRGVTIMNLDFWSFRRSHAIYDRKLQSLAANDLPPEKWSFSGSDDQEILRNYIFYTFEKLWSERESADLAKQQFYIYEDEQQACFCTGLFDKNWQPVYFYCLLNDRPERQKWIFDTFYNSYTIRYTKMPTDAVTNLRRPNYFENPESLIYNVNLNIIPQWDHILDDSENFLRIPEQLRNTGKDFCRNLITGAIESVKKRIQANYKTVVPQWHHGKIQLLAPLYLTNPEIPDLALVLSLSDDRKQYYGHTCLTVEMAYNNARLIARPDSYWLHP